ncbi:MAG: hypothetical protein OXJ64_13155, partial [Boseongicola sp.]|nr:hypothetical protein [Boseongicola sp.]
VSGSGNKRTVRCGVSSSGTMEQWTLARDLPPRLKTGFGPGAEVSCLWFALMEAISPGSGGADQISTRFRRSRVEGPGQPRDRSHAQGLPEHGEHGEDRAEGKG